jgi:hypothetical protein
MDLRDLVDSQVIFFASMARESTAEEIEVVQTIALLRGNAEADFPKIIPSRYFRIQTARSRR